MDSTTIALLVGPMNTSNLKAIKGDNQDMLVEFTDWLCFKSEQHQMSLLLDLRQKWFSYFISRLQNSNDVENIEGHKILVKMMSEVLSGSGSKKSVGHHNPGRQPGHQSGQFDHYPGYNSGY